MSAPLYYFDKDFEVYRAVFIEQPYHILHYKTGDIIFESHTTWDCMMYLNTGTVKLSIVQKDREKLLALYGEGSIIPYMIPETVHVTHLLQYTATSDVTVIKIKKADFEKRLDQSPVLFKALYKNTWQLVHLLTHEVESQTFDSGLEKVATFLYTYFENTGHVRFEFSTKDLQSFVGLNRTNLSKYLSFLIRVHVIEKERGFIKIIAPEKLKSYCSERVIECDLVPSDQIAHASVADDHKWEAVVNRDAAYDGVFWYGVKSTRVYCAPSCKSKTPLRKNAVFFETPQAAETLGYRACKRCGASHIAYNPNRTLLKEVKQFIEKHYAENSAINAYLKTIDSAVAKHFKMQYDVSVHAYVREKQLEAVIQALLETDATVLEIALACGFNSMSNFYAVFKAHYGMTPTQYRESEKRGSA
ncbi:MAG: AraC family transcriptional regulator [Clostridiales bacterium]|jgi:AraC family transcriptional regulator of adaptative response / methylphosphotriester-DNA alkyltransferase methyltransferase|nr:AraC family transcriptional regulator [Clostridiales bacterium]MDN5299789.1 AraC family transcriptional regulator [Clostridiales bacterium]